MRNGVTFNVGSGFSDDQRIEFMTETPSIVEVAYQELTKDGKPRFGTFVRSRDGDKSEID
jgi:ATP-dependent DNA ligase